MTRDGFLDLAGRTYVPGEPMSEADLIAAMISNGHDQAGAEEIARRVRAGTSYAPKGSPYFANRHSTPCHTVRYHHGDGMFTYIGH